HKYADTLKVNDIVGNGFNGQELSNVIHTHKQNGVFTVIVSEKLETVTGADGTQLKVQETFITSDPYLFDSLYIVGGTETGPIFIKATNKFFVTAYEQYKPIGVSTTGQSFISTSEYNNLAGVVFARNNPNFGTDFVNAIAQ